MTAHDHRERVPGCYRCELGADEDDRVSRIVVYDGKAGEWLVIERVEREIGRFLCQQRAEEVAHSGRQGSAKLDQTRTEHLGRGQSDG